MQGIVRMLVHHISKPFDTPQSLYTTGIAVGDYPIDHHHKKNSNAPQHLEFYPVPSFNIPLGVLIPKEIKNFIIAEKSISVSNIVNGTTRLQPCVMQIGQAAGILAALSLKLGINPKNLSVRKVQQTILDANGYIMPYKDVNKNDPYFRAIQKIGATGLIRGKGVSSGWANATYFNPKENVYFSEFSIAWNKKFVNNKVKQYGLVTLKDVLFFAAILSNNKTNTLQSDFILKCKKLGIEDLDFNRPILKFELAGILNEYDVFNVFSVDLFGNYLH